MCAAGCRVVLLPLADEGIDDDAAGFGLGRVAAEMIAVEAADSLPTLICWSRCWPCCSPSLFAMVAAGASEETRMIDLDQSMIVAVLLWLCVLAVMRIFPDFHFFCTYATYVAEKT